MSVITLYSLYLIFGLTLSQLIPLFVPTFLPVLTEPLQVVSMICLSYIMILVGAEFNIDRSNPKQYSMDYFVAATAAACPWIFVALYYMFFFFDAHWVDFNSWRESLVISRFAAPTSAGILFTMLAAAGLAKTWVFKKARILAVFDDLDTVLLTIPLKILFVGLRWQLFLMLLMMVTLLVVAWYYQHTLKWKTSPRFIFYYAAGITLVSELVYLIGYQINPEVPIYLGVVLPSFVLGMLLRVEHKAIVAPDMQKLSHYVSSIFMVIVGISMPFMGELVQGDIPYGILVLHVVGVTILSNLGKCFALFCYRKEATLRQRLAVSIALFPRREMSAGKIIVTISYGLGGVAIAVSLLSLCLNLVLTGVIISAVKYLCESDELLCDAGETEHPKQVT